METEDEQPVIKEVVSESEVEELQDQAAVWPDGSWAFLGLETEYQQPVIDEEERSESETEELPHGAMEWPESFWVLASPPYWEEAFFNQFGMSHAAWNNKNHFLVQPQLTDRELEVLWLQCVKEDTRLAIDNVTVVQEQARALASTRRRERHQAAF